MSSNRPSILGWLVPGVATVVVVVGLVVWQWPNITGPNITGQGTTQTTPTTPTSESSGIIAEFGSLQFGSQQQATTGLARSSDHVKITAVRDGDTLTAHLDIDPGWHVNANPASLDFLIPTKLWLQSGDKTLPATVEYPKGQSINVGLTQPITVFSNQVKITATLTGEPPAKSIKAALRIQACSDKGRCLMPSTVKIPVRSVSGA